MAIDISRLGAAAQKQILKKLREADVKKIEREEKELKELIDRGGAKTAPAVRENKNKLHAERTADGHASKREAKRAAELRLMEQAGKIQNLREQVRYVLVPAIYARPDGSLVKNYDPEKHKKDLEKAEGCKLELLERNLCYVADFVYEQDGETVVEDAKGMKKTNAAIYRIFIAKRKIMLHEYGIRVREV